MDQARKHNEHVCPEEQPVRNWKTDDNFAKINTHAQYKNADINEILTGMLLKQINNKININEHTITSSGGKPLLSQRFRFHPGRPARTDCILDHDAGR